MLYFLLCVLGLQIAFNLFVIGMLLWMLYDTGENSVKALSLVFWIAILNVLFIVADWYFFSILMKVL